MFCASRPVRFGVFQLNAQSGELFKDGVKVQLAEQPLQVLILLLEKAPLVVTREELRQRLWSSDTFVDFDHSMNAAVKRLRQALCDSADEPRYIETLPRHGYRFIGTLDSAVEDEPSAVAPGEASSIESKLRHPMPW